MKKTKIKEILSVILYLISVCFCGVAVITFIKSSSLLGTILLCIGAVCLCLGTTYLNQNNKKDNK